MTKLVSLSNEAYSLLSKRKLEGDSFSTVVVRLVGKDQSGILALAGSLKDESKALEKMKADIYANRRTAKLRSFPL